MRTSKRVTIFEGPDGAGKTTAAQRYAQLTSARYVHFGPLPHVRCSLPRLYIEAMLPALLGYQDVVLDRSWLSEFPYGTVYRPKQPLRVSPADQAMLERVALRCGAAVVNCLPSFDVVRQNYERRRSQELLDNVDQLSQVYAAYLIQHTDLPTLTLDYTTGGSFERVAQALVNQAGQPHPLLAQSAGSWAAQTVLVGERFAEPKDVDTLQQYPFVSFSQLGCSQWLTEQLYEAGISERSLLWVNADDYGLHALLQEHPWRKHVFALGNPAAAVLRDLNVNHTVVPHPQHQKRFNSKSEYLLIRYLKELGYAKS